MTHFDVFNGPIWLVTATLNGEEVQSYRIRADNEVQALSSKQGRPIPDGAVVTAVKIADHVRQLI